MQKEKMIEEMEKLKERTSLNPKVQSEAVDKCIEIVKEANCVMIEPKTTYRPYQGTCGGEMIYTKCNYCKHSSRVNCVPNSACMYEPIATDSPSAFVDMMNKEMKELQWVEFGYGAEETQKADRLLKELIDILSGIGWSKKEIKRYIKRKMNKAEERNK